MSYTLETYEETRTDFSVGVVVTVPPQTFQSTFTTESDNTAVLASPVDGLAVAVAPGRATLIARAANGEVSAAVVDVVFAGGGQVASQLGGVSGSLLEHCNQQIESRIAGKTSSSVPLFSSRNDISGSYVWNPQCWGAELDNITCMSPWNSRTLNGCGGVLITPRHAVFSWHYGFYPKVGDTIRYVRPDNVTETFTIDSLLAHPWTPGWVVAPNDIVVCKLDRDVPASIKFAKVFPVSSEIYLPTLPTFQNTYARVPGLSVGTSGRQVFLRTCFSTQNKGLNTAHAYALGSGPLGQPPVAGLFFSGNYRSDIRFASTDTESLFALQGIPANPLGAAIIGGDSGHGMFSVVNGELVVLGVFKTPDAGTAIHADAANINAMLTELGGGYQLTEADLSEFPTYDAPPPAPPYA